MTESRIRGHLDATFDPQSVLSVSQYHINIHAQLQVHGRNVWSSSICELGDACLRMRHPIVIMLEDHGDEIIASWPEVEAWGCGNTESEAINILKDQIRTLFRELHGESPDSLGDLPLRWQRAMNSVIEIAQSESGPKK